MLTVFPRCEGLNAVTDSTVEAVLPGGFAVESVTTGPGHSNPCSLDKRESIPAPPSSQQIARRTLLVTDLSVPPILCMFTTVHYRNSLQSLAGGIAVVTDLSVLPAESLWSLLLLHTQCPVWMGEHPFQYFRAAPAWQCCCSKPLWPARS